LSQKEYKQNLIKGAHSNLFECAKDMRKDPTKAEQMLWERLRRNALGFKFGRQHPIKNFIPDFYCHTKKLAIELDGSPHFNIEGRTYDKVKEEQLQTDNILVLRFPNSMVEKNIEKVLEIILKKLNRLM
jgi:very-short-patch-repair endonuclease